jgi:hypothetical protein
LHDFETSRPCGPDLLLVAIETYSSYPPEHFLRKFQRATLAAPQVEKIISPAGKGVPQIGYLWMCREKGLAAGQLPAPAILPESDSCPYFW